MSNKIALSSSMRSNLLSLKNTQKLLDTTQDKLSTGYKVNSAMDNPSSYFTAQSLNSRANDLSTLLDSIGQAISTLQTADKGITSLQEFVEQAKSIANSARDTANVASKVTTNNVTFNASTAKTDKLGDIVKVKAGDQFTIRLGNATKMEGTSNVSKDQTLEEIGIKDGASMEMIVGDKTYTFSFKDAATASAVDNGDGTYTQDINVKGSLEDFMSDVVYTVGRKVLNAEVTNGKLSFNTMDNSSLTIRSGDFDSGKVDTHTEARKITEAQITDAVGIGATGAATLTIGGVEVDLGTTKLTKVESTIEAINNNAELAEKGIVAAKDGNDIVVYNTTVGTPVGDISITGSTGGTANGTDVENGNIADAADYETPIMTSFNDVFGFDKGSTVTVTEDMTVEQFRQAVDGLNGIAADFNSSGNLVISGEEGDDMVIADLGTGSTIKNLLGDDVISATNGSNERAAYSKQFNAVLDQIDQLVQDTSYKGINLLKGDDLTVVFNESRTSSLEIKGVTFDSIGLGFTSIDAEDAWSKNESIDKSLDQITKATSMLRSQSSEFGQNLSTVQIREDFTEQMVNNLTTGADKLTLADQNEESANMLALQTRQSLGINSLSLASQSAQSVLKLF